jgi:pimeloyl-ACP methyl ester carboxylesterase
VHLNRFDMAKEGARDSPRNLGACYIVCRVPAAHDFLRAGAQYFLIRLENEPKNAMMNCATVLFLLVSSWSNAEPADLQRASGEVREPTCGTAAGLSYCRYAGDGPPLVLLTGLGNTMRSWPPTFVHALNRFAGVVVYDRRGYGRSSTLPPEPVTATAAAADLDALLAHLKFRQPVVLVGHSLGGLYAQFFARNYQKKVAAVVLLDASSPFEPIDNPMFHTRAKLSPGSTDDLENRGLDASVLQTRESPPFPRIPLIVVSATDHRSPPDFEAEWQRIQAETATQSPLGRFVVAKGSGHDIQTDQPALVIDELHKLVLDLRKGR